MSDRNPIRVLLVEDDPTDAFLLQKELRQMRGADFAMTRAETLEHALARLGEENFDVVVLDLGLPDCQGPDTLIRLRQHQPDVPVVVLTGLDDEGMGIRALQVGAQDYLVKGWLPAPLLGRSLRYAIERHHSTLALRQSEARELARAAELQTVMDVAPVALLVSDRERRITYWNHAAEHLSGFRAEEVIGKRCSDNLLAPADDTGCLLCTGECPLSLTLEDGRAHRAEVYLQHKKGHRVPVEVRACPIQGKNHEIIGAVEIFHDNSRQRALRERTKELGKLAFLDPASQLGNRRYLEQQLSQQLDQYSKSGTLFGIMLADLDELKKINDAYGHVTGDAALVTVAKTLAGCLRATDVVGRWGGDEFLAILRRITRENLATAAEKCRELVAKSTVPVEGSQVQMTISVGAAMVAAGDCPESLLRRADECLYISKQSGRNRVSM